MVSRTCDQCGATVAADEQFCPTCGSFIDPMTPQRPPAPRSKRPSGNVISVTSNGPYEEFSLDSPPAEPTPPPTRITNGDTVECPSCGSTNPASNRHCQHCGARLRQGPLPTAPRPAVQATAGVRAALAISGLLLVVILAALVFNVFGGGGTAASTTLSTVTSTSTAPLENDVIEVIRTDCDPAGIGSLTCANLVSGVGTEYQVNWEELDAEERTIVITLTFRQPMIVSRIDWNNLEDPVRFNQNYRARGLTIRADTAITDFVHELDDEAGQQIIDYAALNATTITITVQSAYNAQVQDGNAFPELAIDEITVWGRTPPAE